MTAEITPSSEEMAALAGQIAHTASDLSHQSNVMAQTIQSLVGSSESLVEVASTLDAGAHEGVERNAQLRALALENRSRLDDSSRSLVDAERRRRGERCGDRPARDRRRKRCGAS